MPEGAKMPVFSDKKVKRQINACRKGNDSRRLSRGRGRRGKGRGRGRSQGCGRGTRGRRGAYGKASKLDERRKLCFDFQKGACHRGASCRYIHMFEGAVGKVQQNFPLSYQPMQQPVVLAGRLSAYPATVTVQPIQQIIPAQPIKTITTSGKDLLPAGWSRGFDPKHGIDYYYNIYTGESQWEKPTKPVVPKNVLTSSAPVVPTIQQPVLMQVEPTAELSITASNVI